MPESISVPSSGSFENKENIGSQMGHANKKKYLKKQETPVKQIPIKNHIDSGNNDKLTQLE